VPFITGGGGGGGSGGGGLLAASYYNPGTGVVTKTFTTSFVALDTANLRATFTAPASGNVVVKVGGGRLTANNSNPFFGVLEAAALLGSVFLALGSFQGTAFQASMKVTGISAGNHSYDFAVADSNLVSATTLQYGFATSNYADGTAPAFIEVWSAP
jgi:hypothetical protein